MGGRGAATIWAGVSGAAACLARPAPVGEAARRSLLR